MSDRGVRPQATGYSLFPPPLNMSDEMGFHSSRRLSPIPRSDDQESDSGAEMRDVPFSRPARFSSRKPPLELAQKIRRHGARGHDERSPPLTPLTPLHTPTTISKVVDFGVTSTSVFSYEPEAERRSPMEQRPREYREEPAEAKEMSDRSDPNMRPATSESLALGLGLAVGAEHGTGKNNHHHRANAINPACSLSTGSSPTSPRSPASDGSSYHTNGTSLPALQQKTLDENDQLEPLDEDEIEMGSYDLLAAAPDGLKQYSLETRSEQLFSTEHLQIIFADPSLLLQFTAFLSSHRQASIPILVYYLDAIKALKAISYSNAIAEALEPIPGFDFTSAAASKTANNQLEEKAKQAFAVLVREDLPAFITHTYIQTVSLSIQRRVTGTLPASLREASEGLAEVFCLTDPSRPDNPIVFASEEFHRTTQYGMSYVIGRNFRFLQGPKTNPFSVRRLREKIDAGVEHCEVFLNYRRDGSPFMNLLMIAPLRDSRGTIRYFIGAQVDISGLVKECSDLESLRRVVTKAEAEEAHGPDDALGPSAQEGPEKDEFQTLSEMLNQQELETVRKWGGRMHKETEEESQNSNFRGGNWGKTRVLINPGSPHEPHGSKIPARLSGHLSGIYENYLLIRPYPSLRILFASPSLRVPGILQSPFMAKIGGSNRVRDELSKALADGRGVTAKIIWVSKNGLEGRNRWIHCTPLIGCNGAIGVWMVVIVDDETSVSPGKRFKTAPPVDPKFGRSVPAHQGDDGSLRDFALLHGGRNSDRSRTRDGSMQDSSSIRSHGAGTDRSASPYSLRI